ncbi:sulfite exporter TauE/SafE family protein [Enterovibrio paralichthyis]|uniref:sulfite exporter TauE/SafE family protein n=1 Tax=Enterovibrio paralichthyis TaxID=2853805 RepID=UPI001C441F69|nr:sulfite exporter TauE/SafE family protein [Enterovibrio paralichthyis]MBV7297645.1 sulfite exporter TauE/SafE family protein [Enterovibrio paralichthyis]
MSLSGEELLLVIVALSAGAFVQSLIGFGLAIVSAPFLMMIEPSLVPGSVTMVTLGLAVVNTWQYRRQLSLKGLGWAFVGRIPGTVVAGALLFYLSLNALEIIMGLAVLLAVVASVFKLAVEPTNKNMFWAGFAAAVMGTTTSIGGPPMALVLQKMDVVRLRANLAGYFIFSCAISLGVQWMAGYFTLWHAKISMYALLPVIICSWVAFRLQQYVKAEWVRVGLLGLCTFAGAATFLRGFS